MNTVRFCAAVIAGSLAAGISAAAELRVYKQPDFSGEELTLRRDANNLAAAGFQDQVSSIEVRSGRWQLCTQPDFRGDCVVIARGDYPTLEQVLNHRIESARAIPRMDRKYGEDRSRYAYRGNYYADNQRRREMRDGMRVWGR
jgi:hypothetical protein